MCVCMCPGCLGSVCVLLAVGPASVTVPTSLCESLCTWPHPPLHDGGCLDSLHVCTQLLPLPLTPCPELHRQAGKWAAHRTRMYACMRPPPSALSVMEQRHKQFQGGDGTNNDCYISPRGGVTRERASRTHIPSPLSRPSWYPSLLTCTPLTPPALHYTNCDGTRERTEAS